MTRKLLIALETQLLHPPLWRALQLGVVALHSSGVRFVSVVFYFVLFCFVCLFLFFFSLRPALASLTPRASAAWGAGGVGRVPTAAPPARLFAAVLWIPGLPSLLLLVCPPPTLLRSRGSDFWVLGSSPLGLAFLWLLPIRSVTWEPRAGREAGEDRQGTPLFS